MTETLEKCRHCSTRKPADEYYRDAYERRYQSCIACTDAARAKRAKVAPAKKCTICNQVQPLTGYSHQKNGRINRSCNKCVAKRVLRQCPHGRAKDACRLCGGSSICVHDRFRPQCRECGGASICQHDRFRPHCRDCDFDGFLLSRVVSRINQALGTRRNRIHLDYLGCTIPEFRAHIEGQLTADMTWENYGAVWHVDHTIPVGYKTDGVKPSLAQIEARLHYTNTQPMLAADNRRKHNKYIGVYIPPCIATR